MATFDAMNRLHWDIEILLADGAKSREIRVCDDGWKIWFKDEAGNTLYSISDKTMQTRQPDRESAMLIIRTRCGWWSNNRELFNDPFPFHLLSKEGERVTDEIIRKYANQLQAIYNNRLAGDGTFVDILADFSRSVRSELSEQ